MSDLRILRLENDIENSIVIFEINVLKFFSLQNFVQK